MKLYYDVENERFVTLRVKRERVIHDVERPQTVRTEPVERRQVRRIYDENKNSSSKE